MAYKNTNTANLRRFNKELLTMTQTIANKVAARAASVIGAKARASFDARQTVYGDARPSGKHGALSLVKTGAARGSLDFTADGGSKIRATLAHEYVKYLIGKYVILPIGNAQLPFQWLMALRLIKAEECSKASPKALPRAA